MVKDSIEKYEELRHVVINDVVVLGHMISTIEGLVKSMKDRIVDITEKLRELNDERT